MIKRGPMAGYEAKVESFPVGAGWWHVVLILSNDAHGRPDETHRQNHPSAYDAHEHAKRLRRSIEEMSTGPFIAPITA